MNPPNPPLKKLVLSLAYLEPDDKVWVEPGARPAHDRDEHGEGGEDEVHVEDEGDEEGEEVDDQPAEVARPSPRGGPLVQVLQQGAA